MGSCFTRPKRMGAVLLNDRSRRGAPSLFALKPPNVNWERICWTSQALLPGSMFKKPSITALQPTAQPRTYAEFEDDILFKRASMPPQAGRLLLQGRD